MVRQSQLNTAAASAQTYATRAYSYLLGISSSTNRYKTWFGTYTASRKSTVQNHFRLINSDQFSSFTYDCACTDPDTYAYVCAYIFRSRDCYSVTDRSLDQIPTSLERSTCAVLSGTLQTLALTPRLELLSTNPPILPSTVVLMIGFMVSLPARAWLSATRIGPSTTPTVTSTLLRTTPFCRYYLSWTLDDWNKRSQ